LIVGAAGAASCMIDLIAQLMNDHFDCFGEQPKPGSEMWASAMGVSQVVSLVVSRERT